ncbi:uncharacterized protein YecE (DUF72 family) [Luteibacter sp. 621]|uniref:DUF72 domain-containing protein n=1 Tax=Luteibacter sp. 621 TaxID=3373916 RepID=UPI003D1DA0C6
MPADRGVEPLSAGSHLERYARVFGCVEVNSSFYRPHREVTYARWASAVPPWFRFSVKVPRAITHDARLRQTGPLLDAFLAQASGLGEKLACLLVQLPPSLPFDAPVAHAFFEALRDRTTVPVVLEPRHRSWFTDSAYKVGRGFGVDWVYAHPRPAGSDGVHLPVPTRLLYLRLHGAPDLYRSSYDASFLEEMAVRLINAKRAGLSTWCVFDNTAHGHAIPNARDLLGHVESAAARQQSD